MVYVWVDIIPTQIVMEGANHILTLWRWKETSPT